MNAAAWLLSFKGGSQSLRPRCRAEPACAERSLRPRTQSVLRPQLSQCVRLCGVNRGALVSADRSPADAGVRIAADRHKYPLRWRALGMDVESQAASTLL